MSLTLLLYINSQCFLFLFLHVYLFISLSRSAFSPDPRPFISLHPAQPLVSLACVCDSIPTHMFGKTHLLSNNQPVSEKKRGVQEKALVLGKAYLLAVKSYLESYQPHPPYLPLLDPGTQSYFWV